MIKKKYVENHLIKLTFKITTWYEQYSFELFVIKNLLENDTYYFEILRDFIFEYD